jgi:hypothetical protein
MRARLPIRSLRGARAAALAALATVVAACGGEPAPPAPIVEGEPRRAAFIAVDPFSMTLGENATAIIPGYTYDPDTVVAMTWSLSPEPPDPDRRRGTIHVAEPSTAVGWTAYVNPVPPRSDYAITFTAVNRRGVRRDTVVRTGIAPSLPSVSISAAPGDTARGGTVRLAVTIVSRDPIVNVDAIADSATLLPSAPDDGQPPAWPRHTPLALALRVTLPAAPGRHTLRVRALDRAGRTGTSAALPVVVP